MTDWFTHLVDKSTIQKTAGKEHYTRISIGYTLTFQPYSSSNPGSGSTPGVKGYLGDDSIKNRLVTWNGGTEFYYVDAARGYTAAPKSINGSTPASSLENDIFEYAIDRFENKTWPVYWQESGTNYFLASEPVMWFNYSDTKAVPVPSSSFTGGFIDRKESKSIKFGTEYNNLIDEQYTVASGTFYYKNTNDAIYTSIALVGDTVTIPANTFLAEETYDAYADLTLDDGTACTYTLDTITTTDGTPEVTAIAPSNIMVYGSATFRWDYENEYGTDQYAYDLQISDDNGATIMRYQSSPVQIILE